jgi:hypothetical protein
MNASHALRAEIVLKLRTNFGLTSLLGGAKIYDETPPHVTFPYVTMGDSHALNWSTDSDYGDEHRLMLHVWSREGGKQEAEEIVGEVLQLLDDMPLTLTGHHLVNMRFTSANIRREKDGRTYHGLIRLRAVTERL